MSSSIDTEQAVRQRYSAAAQSVEPQLCCPVDYDTQYLAVIPAEVIERDYGCGDPSKYVRPGETVLDLGSGGGKICFIAAQVVGASGRVIGVDMNDTMLQLARQSQGTVAEKIGYDNIEFRKGKIQDMAIDRDVVDRYLAEHPINDEAGLQRFESFVAKLRREQPMIPDNSVDVVVSNCVLNLVDPAEKAALFAEIFRVLRPGGRAVISDIVSDEPVPEHLQQDATLWSGCISGALQEAEFMAAFQQAGFHGIEMPVLQSEPWQTVEGIEFRSATVIAYKGHGNNCLDHHEAVIYRGPYQQVVDDDGYTYRRGQRTAVCRRSFEQLQAVPYADDFIPIAPRTPVTPQQAKPFAAAPDSHDDPAPATVRSPRVTKGREYRLTVMGNDCCGTDGCC